MDEKLGALVTGDLTPGVDGLALGAMDRASPLITFAAHGPAVFVRHKQARFSPRPCSPRPPRPP